MPFYNSENIETLTQRQQYFVGHVYAPFIMSKLMEGALKKSNRQLVFSVSDGNDMLYNELETNNDNTSLFKKEVTLDVYGRPWTFQIQAASSFINATSSNQPLIILGGGLFIDFILFFCLLH